MDVMTVGEGARLVCAIALDSAQELASILLIKTGAP
jgi:hypothetical protein